MEYISPRVKLLDLVTEYCNTYAYTVDEAIKAMRQSLQQNKGKTYNQIKEETDREARLLANGYYLETPRNN